MKKNLNFLVVFALVAFLFAGCEKDGLVENDNVKLSGNPEQVAIINGQSFQIEYEKPKNKEKEKGLIIDESTWIEKGIASTLGSSEQYETIKVYRQNNPSSYFYIMIENLRYNPNNNGSWAYDNNQSNVSVYGRLYDWQTANNLKSKIYMRLPKVINQTTVPMKRFGQLPTIQDIKDLLETTRNIGHLPSNGTSVYGGENACKYYYDAFLFGLEEAYFSSDGYHSLAGWRDNLDVSPTNNEFNHINETGVFWLRESSSVAGDKFHFPLRISHTETSTTYLMNAYINVECANRFGFAVRYVFYPW